LSFFIGYGKNKSSKSNKEVFMRITSKGQVTIPLEIREKMGFLPDTEVEFVMDGNGVCLKKIERQSRRSRSLIARLRGKGTVRMTTDEIMTLTRG
jgi:antitoxin PrlF